MLSKANTVTRISKRFSARTDALLRRTRRHFPRLDDDGIEITPIEKGGSDRKFYRVSTGGEQTLILVKYSLEREENRHYVAIAEFLARHGVCVPKIYHHDAAEGLIWIEDLGTADLWSYRNEAWSTRGALYREALGEAARLHSLPEAAVSTIASSLPAEFDTALYRWEQGYFFENCLARYFKVDAAEVAECAALPKLQQIAQQLGEWPRVLVHRDFQSQNILVRNGRICLIDFQGMRPGLAEYDVASLLYDPYVTLTATERAELLAYYKQVRAINSDDFDRTLELCALQRLMQALGAYGFLGLVKGNSAFLSHIAPAVHSLRLIASHIGGLERLRAILDQLL